MTAAEGYIHWHLSKTNGSYDEVTAPFKNYAIAKKDLFYNLNIEGYSNAIKKQFEQYDMSNEQFLNLASCLVNNSSFQSALDSAIERIKIPEYKGGASQKSLQGHADKYNSLVRQIKESLASIIAFLGTKDLDIIETNPEIAKALNQLFKDNLSGYKENIITLDEYSTLSKQLKTQYNTILSQLPDFMGIINKKPTEANVEIVLKILSPIQAFAGFLTEHAIEKEVDKIIENLQKEVAPGVTIKQVGEEQSSAEDGFKIQTADLSISLNGSNSNLNFKVPNLGISVKRTHHNVNDTKRIPVKIKETNLGKLMSKIDPYLVTCFYTLMANTKPGKQVSVEREITTAYQYMKLACLIPALIGDISAQDLVTIFVINNQAYTIFDLLQRMGSSDRILNVIATSPARKALHDRASKQHQLEYRYKKDNPGENDITNLANERSDAIRNFIDHISMKVQLKLSSEMLRK